MSFFIHLPKLFAILVCVFLISLTVYQVVFDLPKNGCSMTWMYEYPEYLRVRLPAKVERKYPKYGLFIYGEGVYANYLRSMKGKYKLEGIPVLFVHGNAGRYKQVRSPASVCLRKSETRAHHFNYFSVDYEEELSAIYGPFLYRQTEYLYFAIRRIFKCYDHLNVDKPTSLITIGHSMGGLVLRGLFSLPPPTKQRDRPSLHDQISTIVTLASPHIKPLVTLDEDIYKFYAQTNQYWMAEYMNVLQNISLLSLGGGVRDYLVRSDLCSFRDISSNPNHMSIMTNCVPLIWLSTDHQCIVWCNELVRGLTRTFFNMIDLNTHQITTNPVKRAREISRVFFGAQSDEEEIPLPSDCVLLRVDKSVRRTTSESNSCYRLALKNGSMEEGDVVNVWSGSGKRNWVYFCDEDRKTCESINYDVIRNGQEISKFISLRSIRQVVVKFRSKETFLIQRLSSITHQVVPPFLLPTTSVHDHVNAFHCIVNLPTFTESWQVFSLYYYGDKSDLVMKLYVPWTGEREFLDIDRHGNETIRLRIHSNRPERFAGGNGQHYVQLHVWKPMIGDMKVTLTPRIAESFARLVHANVELLLRYVLVFGILFKLMNGKNVCNDGVNVTMQRLWLVSPLVVLFIKVVWYTISNTDSCLGSIRRRIILPEICLLSLSVLLYYSVQIVLTVIIRILYTLIYPAARMVEKIIAADITSRWFVKASSMAFIGTLLHFKVPVCILFLVLLVFDVMKLSVNQGDTSTKYVREQTLLAILPSMLVFNAAPFVIFVKDITDGFPYQQRPFFNVIMFVCAYDVFLLSDIAGKTETKRACANLCRCFVLVSCIFGFFPEFIVFYRLVYLSVGYLVYVILYSSNI